MSSDSELEDFVPTSSKGRQRGSRINVGNDLSTTSVSMKKSKHQQQIPDKLTGGSNDGARVRVRFITRLKDPSLHVTRIPIAVPVSLGRYGLSEVINHLRGVTEGTDVKPIPFDVLVRGVFLRKTLETHMDIHAISREDVLELEYLPSLRVPDEVASDELSEWITCLSIAGGRWFLSGCCNGTVNLHSAKDCKRIFSAPADKQSLCTVTVTMNGKENREGLALTGGGEGTVNLWRITSNKLEPITKLIGHDSTVTASAFACQKQDDTESTVVAVTGDFNGGLRLWDYKEAVELTSSEKCENEHNEGLLPPSISKRRRLGSEMVLSPSVQTLTSISSFKAHTQKICGICSIPNGLVYTGSWDRSMKLWHLGRKDCLQTIVTPKAITCLDVCPTEGYLLASGHADGSVRIWDTRASQEVFERVALCSHKHWVTGVQWLSDDHLFANCTQDGKLMVWDVRSQLPLHTLAAHDGKALALAACEGVFLSSGSDGIVRKFSLPSLEQRWMVAPPNESNSSR